MFQNSDQQSVSDEERMYMQLSTLSTLTKDYERLYARLQKTTEKASEEPPRGLRGWFLKITGQYDRAEIVSSHLNQVAHIKQDGDQLITEILGAARIASRAIRSTNEQSIGRIMRLNHAREVKGHDFIDTARRYRKTIEVVSECASVNPAVKEFITWIDTVDSHDDIEPEELARRSAELTNTNFSGAFSGADLEYLTLNERLGHEEKWRTIVQKAEAEENSHLQAVNAENLRAFTTQYEIICEHTARKFEVEIERFYDEIKMLKGAIALEHLSKLESHLKNQSEKIKFIREELIVNSTNRSSQRKSPKVTEDDYGHSGYTIEASVRQIM